MDSYSNVFQAADYSALQKSGFPMRGRWNSDYFKNENPIVLELGCGKGEYTIGLARLYPDKNFIGIDIKGARMFTGATVALEQKLSNVAFLRTHIEFLDNIFAEDEVSEAWITFPDPQMQKPRKRLVGTMMLGRYQRYLKPEGVLHLKTDSNFLFEYASAMFKANNIVPEVITGDLYKDGGELDIDPTLLTIQTYYEEKWLSHGLKIKYLRFRAPFRGEELVEPEVDIEYDTYHSVGRGVKEFNRKN
ncbi:MAG: tRNA (guanosine(46)-N7)-methyltransferase TrmB [Marinilabiliaceae bacterium]|nr:tRNA (guanosine(46)-N7)-methyltransferase TrmB [Marinilabiliaceae bacterium]